MIAALWTFRFPIAVAMLVALTVVGWNGWTALEARVDRAKALQASADEARLLSEASNDMLRTAIANQGRVLAQLEASRAEDRAFLDDTLRAAATDKNTDRDGAIAPVTRDFIDRIRNEQSRPRG